MKIAIWKRYFCFRFLEMFFFFLFSFYGFYILIDYASHTGILSSHSSHWKEMIVYYFYLFAMRAEILIPLALLIAFIHTTTSLNLHRELAAFMASGFDLQKLLRPFLFIGIGCVALLYFNEEFFLPHALEKLRRFENQTKHKRNRNVLPIAAHQIGLEDGSLFIFQTYDPQKKQFFDAYWVKSIDSIYRMKYVTPSPLHGAQGIFVDHLTRQANGELLQTASYPTFSFPDMHIHQTTDSSLFFDPDIFSLSDLIRETSRITSSWNENESKAMTALYWKLIIPWLSLLAIIAPAPFCIRFSRKMSPFFIYISALFGLIALYMFLDAAQIVSKRQVLSPIWTLLVPFFFFFSYFSARFYLLDCRE